MQESVAVILGATVILFTASFFVIVYVQNGRAARRHEEHLLHLSSSVATYQRESRRDRAAWRVEMRNYVNQMLALQRMILERTDRNGRPD